MPYPAFVYALSFLALPFQGKYTEADPLYLRAIEVAEKMLGRDHPYLATSFNNRAELLRAQARVKRRFYLDATVDLSAALFTTYHGNYAETDPLYER